MSILEKYHGRCPNCNQGEVQLEDDRSVYCSYCKNIWGSIYNYETDCKLKEREWELEQKLENVQELMQENIETKWIKSSDAYLGQECVIDGDWFNRWIAKMNKALVGFHR